MSRQINYREFITSICPQLTKLIEEKISNGTFDPNGHVIDELLKVVQEILPDVTDSSGIIDSLIQAESVLMRGNR